MATNWGLRGQRAAPLRLLAGEIRAEHLAGHGVGLHVPHRLVHHEHRDRDLPLVVASGEDQIEVKQRLERYAPIRFLGKPYDLNGLKNAIETSAG